MLMKHLIVGLVPTVAIALLTVAPVDAHHAFAAEFDANRPVTIRGVIVKVDWMNPHSWFHVDVKRPDGQVERWQIEAGSPGPLTRRGFTKDYLKPGTEVIIQGYMAKGVARRANGRTMQYPDGRTLFMGSSGTGAPTDGKDPTERD